MDRMSTATSMTTGSRTAVTNAAKTAQIDTLKGVFAMPQMNHRRDFLRENKLSLKELQRITGKKQQQNEPQQRLQRPQRQQQQQQSQANVVGGGDRRSASQQRTPAGRQKAPPLQQQQRSLSQQRSVLGQSQPNLASGRQQAAAAAAANYDQQSLAPTQHGSIGTLCSNTSRMSCDKEIQTDDIHDEAFLYKALRKCSSVHNTAISSKDGGGHKISHSDPNMPAQHGLSGSHDPERQIGDDYDERQSYYAQDYRAPPVRREVGCDIPSDLDYLADEPGPHSSRSHAINGSVARLAGCLDDQHMLGGAQQQRDLLDAMEQPLSGRSRRTICSTKSQESTISKKTSSSSLHKLGSRDDLRLPRYLEREKREREEQRQRDIERDPNCPLGHYAVREDDRQAVLMAAEKKFKALVQELNRMPMTMETLRIRTRKGEIEKELASLEAEIRIYSKHKVYLPEQTE